MSGNKILKIFMTPQEFPCGEQSSCCGPIGQSEEEIESLKGSLEKELGCGVEVLNVKNDENMRSHPRIAQLVHSLGPAALPIITLEDEVVSMGNATAEEALAAIREKTGKKNFGKDNKAQGQDNPEQANSRESTGNAEACCPSASGDGSCCASDSDGGGKSWKTLIFILIVIAAGVVLARALIRKSNSTTGQAQESFAAIQPEAKLDIPSPLNPTAKKETPAESKGALESPLVVKDTTKKKVSDKVASTVWGSELDSLASLNKVTTNTDAVFVLLAAEDQQDMQPITGEIEAAAKKIQSNGSRISAFRLKKDAPNYGRLAIQFSLPCVLAMVKGRGMSGVSGEITEAKLIEAFVMASRPTLGCCPGSTSCGPTGNKK